MSQKRDLVERLARKAGLHPMPLNIKEFERLAELVAEECAQLVESSHMPEGSCRPLFDTGWECAIFMGGMLIRSKFGTT